MKKHKASGEFRSISFCRSINFRRTVSSKNDMIFSLYTQHIQFVVSLIHVIDSYLPGKRPSASDSNDTSTFPSMTSSLDLRSLVLLRVSGVILMLLLESS
jgi:hypothetical protein